jgi:glycosyltransferase involved in cell wall biosynthesis
MALSRSPENRMALAELPVITVGILTLNREWSIGAVLDALSSQTYPHSRIYVLVVDGGSTDGTVEKARAKLQGSDFLGYRVIVERSNIPEARNICADNMVGDMLFFLDSDVLIEPQALEKLVAAALSCGCDIISPGFNCVYIESPSEVAHLLDEIKRPSAGNGAVLEVPAVVMGHTLIRREVFSKVRFDTEVNYYEDLDFCINARSKGFTVCLHTGVRAVDVNIRGSALSDVFVHSPLKQQIRGLRKKARAKTYALGFKVTPVDVLRYFLKYKRHLFYLSYAATIPLSLAGLALGNPLLASTLPAEVAAYLAYQVRRRGLKGGLKTTLLSVLVGLPLAALMLAYSFKAALEPGQDMQSSRAEGRCSYVSD